MIRFLLRIALLVAVPAPVLGVSTTALAECASSWSTEEYRSYDAVEKEVGQRFDGARILRIALCGKGERAYFQVVAINRVGVVRTLQLSARK